MEYLVEPNGCIVWEPTPEDYERVREEEAELMGTGDE
jgi:hypothetical protein